MIYRKLILIFVASLLASNLVTAIGLSEETSTVSRIVGESPNEMIQQMQRDSINLNHATYFSHDNWNNKKDNILEKQFGIDINGNMNQEFDWFASYSFDDVQNSLGEFQNNELFILESEGKTNPLHLTSRYDELYPRDTRNWRSTFTARNPLLLFDAPYSGIYIPKEDNFISRLAKDATIISPTSFNSPQFTKSFLCQLVNDKTIGEIYRDARNFHYNGGSKASRDNLIGLILQSYSLYGNPRQKVLIDWYEHDKEIIKSYCNNFLKNLAPDIEFLEQVGNYSKFRKHLILEIPEYTIDEMGEFSILTAENTFQNQEPGELVLPIAVRTTYFPIDTIITNYSLYGVEDAVELTIENLPSFELGYTNRTCYQESSPYTINFENSYTEDTQNFIARINPVEVVNCTQGELKLHKRFRYSIDYIPKSPVLIEKVNTPLSASVNEQITIEINLLQLTQDPVQGTLAIFDQDNNPLWQQEITTDTAEITAAFQAPSEEGKKRYSVEFIYNEETVNYKDFSVFIDLLDLTADIPISVVEPSIDINIFSYSQQNLELEAAYYLIHNNNIKSSGGFTKTILPGDNLHTINFNELRKEDQSYTLTIELTYLNQRKTVSYLLTTNNVPQLYAETKEEYESNEPVIITFNAIDYDLDELTYGINDERFERDNNQFIWGDPEIGDYEVTITANDGLAQDSYTLLFNVVEPPNESPIVEVIDDINVMVGELINITIYAVDPDGDELTYSINDQRFIQDNNSFTWQTQQDDPGVYNIQLTVSDGIHNETQDIQITINGLPDLKIADWHVPFCSLGPPFLGIEFTADITNIGYAVSPETTLSFIRNSIGNPNQHYEYSYQVPTIQPQETITIDTECLGPQITVMNMETVITVDPDDIVEESNEMNNNRSIVFRVA